MAVLAALASPTSPLTAQEPPDSLPPDSLVVDTAAVDSLQEVPDSLQAVPDSLQQTPDSLVFHELPVVPGGRPAGWDRGVWVWEREDLINSRALTLAELLSLAPGVIPVRGGDYGTPVGVTAFGATAGRLRVFMDGFELVPLDGGVPDLSRVSMGGLESVRLERGPTGLRVELQSYRVDDPRPMSLVEAGTGDLRTNHFRGTFVHPRALGGSLGLDLERLDTQGPRGAEPGSLTGGWFRYSLHRGDAAGLRFEFRTQSAESELELYPPRVTRREWTVQARARLTEGVVAEAFTGQSSVEGGTEDSLTVIDASRAQHGARLGVERGPAWGRASYRLLASPDLPASAFDVEAGATWPGRVGLSARWSREDWDGTTASGTSATVWTEPLFGVSAFATWEDGTVGSRIFPVRVPVEPPGEGGEEGEGGGEEEQPGEPEEPAGPTHRFTERTGYRLGATARVGPLTVSGARLFFEADSLPPFGLLMDREALTLEGGEFTGLEGRVRLRLPVEGFALEGSVQRWDDTNRYLPELIYAGAVQYHGSPTDSESLEIWGSVGVEGRDPMTVPFLDEESEVPLLQQVPFAQSWNGFLQIRIVTVRIFLRFENFTIRDNNQDLPDRVLPPTRATYGVRWTFWN